MQLPITLPGQMGARGLAANEGRWHFIVEDVHGNFLSRDLVVQNAKLLRALSGQCNIQFDFNYQDYSAAGIYFKPWKQWIHAEKVIRGNRIIWASGIVVPSQIDKKTGVMHLEAQGFSGYMKKLPMLFNWNPLVVDPFETVHKIWDHIQSYPTGNLGVEVYPALSGIEMLPGYAFDGEVANLNFTAEFIRASDKQDCGDHVDKLARDIPFDYVEQSAWNEDFSAITKKLYLGYPKAGVEQDALSFVINENVIEASPHIETQIDWASDVIVDGWFPGSEYSASLTNADPDRYRRVISQDDARINSNERAAAWAKKKLARRQTPAYWDSIIVDPGHPNAPFGDYDVGDRIFVKGLMPWVGNVAQFHKIIAMAYDEKTQTVQITMMPEGAYNYDPIFYPGDESVTTLVVPTTLASTSTGQVPTLGPP